MPPFVTAVAAVNDTLDPKSHGQPARKTGNTEKKACTGAEMQHHVEHRREVDELRHSTVADRPAPFTDIGQD